MIVKTRGIVLGYIKYGESSIIVKTYTHELGAVSLIVNSIRSQKAKRSIGYFQPFSLLELVLYVKESRDLQRISEFKSYQPLHFIHQDMIKSSITLFLSEVLGKLVVAEQSPNHDLYGFLDGSIKSLEQLKAGVENFHLQFLLKLSDHLGYGLLDLEELFTSINQLSPDSIDLAELNNLYQHDYGHVLKMNGVERNEILTAILNFYRHHVEISKVNSMEILRKVLS